jgi:hypothetical protein
LCERQGVAGGNRPVEREGAVGEMEHVAQMLGCSRGHVGRSEAGNESPERGMIEWAGWSCEECSVGNGERRSHWYQLRSR